LIRYDEHADYQLERRGIDRPIQESEEVVDGIVADYDADCRIVGIEILDVSKRTDDPATLKQFGFELPSVG
jgi:uncharacterized protein YuzE